MKLFRKQQLEEICLTFSRPYSFLTTMHHQHSKSYKSVMWFVFIMSCDYVMLSGCCRTAGTMAPSTSTAWTRWAGEL